MPRKLRRCWLILLGLLPCLGALAAGRLPPPPLSLPARSLPPLSFDQYGVSYGQIGPQPVVEAHFTFRNVGDRPVTIERVVPSCGCLRWHLPGDQRTYRPGEPGCLTVRLATANERPGPHHYTLEVTTAGATPQTERLSFRVILPELKVTIDPAEVFFYQLSGRPDSRTVYVTDHRPGRTAPLQIVSAECSSPHIQVELGSPERDGDTGTRIPIHLTAAGKVPPGREITALRLTTNDAEFPRLLVPLLIEGPPSSMPWPLEYGPPALNTRGTTLWEGRGVPGNPIPGRREDGASPSGGEQP